MKMRMRLFPRIWRDRYGDEFLEVFDADPRTVRKWADLVRTALELRLEQLFGKEATAAVLISVSLTIVASVDLALGVGMDERMDVQLLARHWWGAPFLAALLLSGILLLAGSVQVLRRSRRALSVLLAAVVCAAGAVAVSAAFAAFAFELAAVGAGVGLVVATAIIRASWRTRLSALDLNLIAGVALVIYLGWRTASSPIGPAVLLIVCALLLVATHAAETPRRTAQAA